MDILQFERFGVSMHNASLAARLAGAAIFAALAAHSLPAQLPLSGPRESTTPPPIAPARPEAYRDFDLLRRDGFQSAQTATALLRITGKNNEPPSDLKPRDFIFLVNGTPRAGHLHAPNVSTAAVVPLVLLVFPPNQLSVAESVDDTNLAMPVLEREVDVHWNGRKLLWERDSHLRPGNYVWRIALHDGAGRVFASSEEKVGVGMPRSPQLALSSLILGKACLESAAPASGLRRRAAAPDTPHPLIDPMRAGNCRVQPDATGSFHPQDTLHAFVRIYPSGKWKQRSESWTATFQLRSPSGEVEAQKQLPFTVDSGSGYLASIQLPLNTPAIHAGAHMLGVEVQGPGARGNLGQSRAVFIEDDAPAAP